MRISDWSSDVCSSDLDPLAAPSLPAEFSAAIRGVMKGPDVGSCGTAAYMRQPVFVTDIANDPKWAKFKDLALAADLRACWSAPIPGHDGEAVGALALYFREPRIPLEHERSLRSEEHTSEIQSLMRISYAVFCLTKQNTQR